MGEVTAPEISLDTHPDQYNHWQLTIDGEIATLAMDVEEDASVTGQVDLVLNSYDLGVDIELADAIQRLRFEHPEVRVVVMSSAKERIFCAGANIRMLAASTHPFKVNFCKFTNETRLNIEDASAVSGQKYIAACNGVASGGGYELALACDEIILVDDRSSAVSLPEVPLLGVLPGTGGSTRVVDKRGVRRDLADHFSSLAEGVRGKRAVESSSSRRGLLRGADESAPSHDGVLVSLGVVQHAVKSRPRHRRGSRRCGGISAIQRLFASREVSVEEERAVGGRERALWHACWCGQCEPACRRLRLHSF